MEVAMMENDLKALCLSLLAADTEEKVVQILKDAGFWDIPTAWRYLGDREDNFSIIGNQQSRPEAALVEKVVNSVDAVLMNECWMKGLSPEDAKAPKNIHEAVALFFMGDASKVDTLGHIENWSSTKRTEVSRLITVTATGATATSGGASNPCFTIVDAGEGQTPSSMPLTILSLDKKNKLRIHFVQGKFNMGGTGVLQFCGHLNLQLIISHRNPSILKNGDNDSGDWGFTLVRRENPPAGQKSSVYTYLAPLGADKKPRMGGILHFSSDTLPIFPDDNVPYKRAVKWGTAIKLYEYNATGFRTMMFRKDGLLSRLDILLPEIALPIRLHECRDYKGHPGSFETTLSGLTVRLEDNKAENLEDGFPATGQFMAKGESMDAKIYAFRQNKADTYKKNEGLIFTVNGQTHGHLPLTFFGRKTVGMGRLDDSILVVVDCSNLSGRAREDLFMNSRDRLRGGDLRDAIEKELEILVRDHSGLRSLKEKRRHEEIESKLSNSKPLEKALELILKASPSLLALFSSGTRLSNPFKTAETSSSNKPFHGSYHPTFFKFEKLTYGHKLERRVAVNMRSRVIFETNAVNDYFSRPQNKGLFTLKSIEDGKSTDVQNYGLNLHDGRATLSLRLPQGSIVGQVLEFETSVVDDTLLEPFVNRFALTVGQPQIPQGSPSGGAKPPNDRKGHERDTPIGLTIPEVFEVTQSEWENRKPKFDQFSALQIIQEEAANENELAEDGTAVYSFWVNIDNIHFKRECKYSKEDPKILKARWKYGLALIGMALVQADSLSKKVHTDDDTADRDQEGTQTLEQKVFEVTSAVAPVILPIVETLGSLTEEQVSAGGQIGDDE
jgi:hypothetical protein